MASNFFNKASLVMVPDAPIDGIQPSVKPEDRSGDFTFTRGSNLSATRVNKSQLIEKGRENLLTYSNDFSQGVWLTNNASVASGQSGYDGSNNAWALISTATNSRHRIVQTFTGGSSSVVTYSVFAKSNGYNFIRIIENASTGDFATFNLLSGSVANNTGIANTAIIASVGNGWYRCSISVAGANTTRFDIYAMETSGSTDFLGDGVSGAYIQDAQAELGLAATSVITTGAGTVQAGLLENTPRLDYSGGATCPSLLLEPSRTNIFSQSEYYNTYWNRSNSSVANNQSTSPEGLINASVLSVVSPSQAGINVLSSWSDSTTYTMSAFVKKKIGSYIGFGLYGNTLGDNWVKWNLDNGTSTINNLWTNANFEDYGNGWYRISATITTTTGNTSRSGFKLNPMKNSSYSNGNVGDEVYIYGVQLESNASYPTSYIPTYGTSQTRSADISKLTGSNFTDVFSGNGTIYTNFENKDNAEAIGYWARGSSGGTYGDMIKTAFSVSNRLQVEVRANQVSQVVYNSAVTSIGFHKVAVSYNNGDVVIYMDGVKLATYEDKTMPDLNELYIGQYIDTNFRSATKKEFLIFPTALSDDECIALTTI